MVNVEYSYKSSLPMIHLLMLHTETTTHMHTKYMLYKTTLPA